MFSIRYVAKFKKDLKRYQFQKTVLNELNDVLRLLLSGKKLPDKYRDHPLVGGYVGMRECHIKPDVLLIYWLDLENKELIVERLGSHAELFQ